MLPRRNQILVMKVRGFQQVEQRQVGALSLVKTLNLFGRFAPFGYNELNPAVVIPVQHPCKTEGRMVTAFVQPGQQLLEMGVQGQRTRLVNELKPAIERQFQHAPSLAVRIALTPADLY